MKNLTRRNFLKTIGFGTLAFGACSLTSCQKNGLNPNIIYIMADDLGYGDVSCLNAQSKLKTDNIDQLAKCEHYPGYHFRGHKADIYEGGHRIPFIASWPNRIKPGTENAETICLTDLLATCVAIVGDKLPDNAGEDSCNILPAMIAENYHKPIREATVHHSVNGSFAIRQGKWKLELCPGSGGWSFPKPEEARQMGLPPVQLYDLENDIGETTNLFQEHPDVVERLKKLLAQYIRNGRSTPGMLQQNDPVADWPQISWIEK